MELNFTLPKIKIFDNELTKDRYSLLLLDCGSKTLYEFCKELKMNENTIREMLEIDNFTNFMENFRSITAEVLERKSTAEEKFIMAKFFDFITNYYGHLHGKYFIVDIDKYRTVSHDGLDTKNRDYSKVNWDACGDIFVDFRVGKKFLPLTLKYLVTDYYTKSKENESFKTYNLALNCVNNERNGIIDNYMALSFVPALYPRVLMEENEGGPRCDNCELKNKRIMPILGDAGIINLKAEFCLIGRNSQEKCKSRGIEYHVQTDKGWEKVSLSIYECIELIAHICTVFENRKTLQRKNGKARKEYKRSNISIATGVKRSSSIVSLATYPAYEQRGKKEWQGGHHESPVEHYRQGHKRVIRNSDGSVKKVVEVRGTTVNKGKDKKVIYKV